MILVDLRSLDRNPPKRSLGIASHTLRPVHPSETLVTHLALCRGDTPGRQRWRTCAWDHGSRPHSATLHAYHPSTPVVHLPTSTHDPTVCEGTSDHRARPTSTTTGTNQGPPLFPVCPWYRTAWPSPFPRPRPQRRPNVPAAHAGPSLHCFTPLTGQ